MQKKRAFYTVNVSGIPIRFREVAQRHYVRVLPSVGRGFVKFKQQAICKCFNFLLFLGKN